MVYDQAWEIVEAVEKQHDVTPYLSAYSACKKAGYTMAEYKQARDLVSWG
ncbi:TPA: hypothetical protein ACGW3M_000997 [Pseudomonas aeruginosa]|nr:hypothetical protein [Pseudomonas aeruginosa]EKY4113663.1 hypothetical protein [Pseudomonas aeruginosa]ELJ2276185.1 hypothetical protein [Pseudomonas aeruginosa]HCH7782757.1 hypothetical protein [Pseudomonas aeruginosa]